MQTDGVQCNVLYMPHMYVHTYVCMHIGVCANTVCRDGIVCIELYGMISCIAVWFSRGDSACVNLLK